MILNRFQIENPYTHTIMPTFIFICNGERAKHIPYVMLGIQTYSDHRVFFDITLDNVDTSMGLGLEIVVSTAAATAYKKFKFIITQAVDHKLWFVLLVSFLSLSLALSECCCTFFFFFFSSSVCEQHLAALRLKNERIAKKREFDHLSTHIRTPDCICITARR